MVLDDVPHDREAEPRPAGLPRASPVHTVEALEDTGEVARGDPGPSVADRQHGVVVGRRQPDVDAASGTRVPDRVVDQVPHEQREITRGPAHAWWDTEIDRQLDAGLAGRLLE